MHCSSHSTGNPGRFCTCCRLSSDAKDEATGRLKNMIEDCIAVRPHIPYDGFASSKQINLSGPRTIYMAWAAAARTLIRRTCRYVFFDELDNCEQQAGDLGNHLSVAAERTTTYGYRGKVFDATTPTTTDGAAWTEWMASDQRRYYVPCPHCGTYQILSFSQIKWPEGERDPDAIEHGGLAWYQCLSCKEKIEEGQRKWMVDRGAWIPASQCPGEVLPLKKKKIVEQASRTDHTKWTPKLNGEKPRTRRIGYHIWSAYSPWRTFAMIAAEFLRTKGDPEMYRVFVNSWLGEPWSDTALEMEASSLQGRRVDAHERDTVPEFVQHIGMAADTQTDHFVYAIRGWGERRQSALIREGYCETMDDLYGIFQQEFPQEGTGRMMHAHYLAIDSGGDRTNEIYQYAKIYPGVEAVKGHPATAKWYVKPTKIDFTPKGTAAKRSLMLYVINVDFYKDAMFRMMKSDDPTDPGFWGLHRDTTQDYLDQVTAEHKVWIKKMKNGHPVREKVWVPKATNRDNHFLDLEVYGMAIADELGWLNLAAIDKQARSRSSKTIRRNPQDFLERQRQRMPQRR